MSKKTYVYWCTSCQTRMVGMPRRGVDEATFRERHNVPQDLFTPGPANIPDSGVCPRCVKEYMNPYLVYLGPGVTPARAVIMPSIHFTFGGNNEVTGSKRVPSLKAVDPIPANKTIIYPGKIIDEWQLQALKEKYGVQLTHEYTKGGPKNRGVRLLIYANTVSRKKNPYACGGRVNARKSGSGQMPPSNVHWGHVRVTQDIKNLFPESGDFMEVGKDFTCLRFSKDVKPGEEIIVTTYGAGFWARAQLESKNTKLEKTPRTEKEQKKWEKQKRTVNSANKANFNPIKMMNPYHQLCLEQFDLSTLTSEMRRAREKKI